jgi:maleate cis-trans isomerase
MLMTVRGMTIQAAPSAAVVLSTVISASAPLSAHNAPGEDSGKGTAMRLGWRARIGQIRPASAIEGAEEWRSVAPVGVAFADTRTLLEAANEQGLAAMMTQVVRAARELATAQVDLIVQCGAPGIFLRGTGYDDEVIAQIHEATGIRSTTMMTATVDAMRAVGIRRVAVASIYIDEVNAKLETFLEEAGFEVTAIEGLQIVAPADCIGLEPDRSYRMARSVFEQQSGADGILISCGSFPTFEILDALERDTGVPVISSNQATLWKALRMLDLPDRIPGLGQLFARC